MELQPLVRGLAAPNAQRMAAMSCKRVRSGLRALRTVTGRPHHNIQEIESTSRGFLNFGNLRTRSHSSSIYWISFCRVVGDSVARSRGAGDAALYIRLLQARHQCLKTLVCGVVAHNRAGANRRRRSLYTATVIAAAQGLATSEQLGYKTGYETADSPAQTYQMLRSGEGINRPKRRAYCRQRPSSHDEPRTSDSKNANALWQGQKRTFYQPCRGVHTALRRRSVADRHCTRSSSVARRQAP